MITMCMCLGMRVAEVDTALAQNSRLTAQQSLPHNHNSRAAALHRDPTQYYV